MNGRLIIQYMCLCSIFLIAYQDLSAFDVPQGNFWPEMCCCKKRCCACCCCPNNTVVVINNTVSVEDRAGEAISTRLPLPGILVKKGDDQSEQLPGAPSVASSHKKVHFEDKFKKKRAKAFAKELKQLDIDLDRPMSILEKTWMSDGFSEPAESSSADTAILQTLFDPLAQARAQ